MGILKTSARINFSSDDLFPQRVNFEFVDIERFGSYSVIITPTSLCTSIKNIDRIKER